MRCENLFKINKYIYILKNNTPEQYFMIMELCYKLYTFFLSFVSKKISAKYLFVCVHELYSFCED